MLSCFSPGRSPTYPSQRFFKIGCIPGQNVMPFAVPGFFRRQIFEDNWVQPAECPPEILNRVVSSKRVARRICVTYILLESGVLPDFFLLSDCLRYQPFTFTKSLENEQLSKLSKSSSRLEWEKYANWQIILCLNQLFFIRSKLSRATSEMPMVCRIRANGILGAVKFLYINFDICKSPRRPETISPAGF